MSPKKIIHGAWSLLTVTSSLHFAMLNIVWKIVVNKTIGNYSALAFNESQHFCNISGSSGQKPFKYGMVEKVVKLTLKRGAI